MLVNRLADPLNSGWTDRKVDQILVSDRTGQTDAKVYCGPPLFKKTKFGISRLLFDIFVVGTIAAIK